MKAIDPRRTLIIPGDAATTQAWALDHFISCAQEAIAKRGTFAAALSGGSTPKGIYEQLSLPENRGRVDWNRVFLFWSDERAVSPNDPESNYFMAMEAGLGKLSIPATHIFRMAAEKNLEENALHYENLIATHVENSLFDLIMLGMGDDGHIASLFPYTKGLEVSDRHVIANYVPQKECWRMTFTYPLINQAKTTALYVLGSGKSATLKEVLAGAADPMRLPAQRIGTPNHPSLWIADQQAAQNLPFSC